METLTVNYFDGIIGQKPAVNRLNFIMEGYKRTNIVSHLLFCGSKGVGKTHFARKTAESMHKIRKCDGKTKPIVEVNGSSLKSIKSLAEMVLLPFCQDREYTIFIDELHEIGGKVTAALLSILNPNSENRNTFNYEGMPIDIDFKRTSFMFATTELQKIFEPLRDRLTEISLSDYTVQDLAKIIAKNVTSVSCKEDATNELATFCKSNARSAAKMGREVETYCGALQKYNFLKEDVKPLVNILDLFPLGLNRIEVNILKDLNDMPESSLKILCAKSGLTPPAQQNVERMMLKFGLMEINGKRSLTTKGKEYLKNLETW